MRRTSRKIASRTSRPIKANGKRASKRGGAEFHRLEATARAAGWTVDRTRKGHLVFRSPDKSVPPVYTISEESDPHSLANTQALLRRHGLETRESHRVKKNADSEPQWLHMYSLGPGRSVIIYEHSDGRIETRIFMHGGDVFELLRTDFFDTVEQARAAAPQLSMPSRKPPSMASNRMRRNPIKPSDKRLLKMLEEKCGPASEWHGRCTEISREASKLVGHPDVYGHYRGPVHEGGYWGERKGHPFIQHGWVKLPAGKVLDPTRFSFEHRDPYIYIGKERSEYDEGGQIVRAQLQARRPIPKRGEGPDRRFTYQPGPEAARFIEMIFGPDEVDLHDVNGSVDLSLYQAFYLANMSYDALRPYTHAIYEAIARAGNKSHIPLDNQLRAKREETR